MKKTKRLTLLLLTLVLMVLPTAALAAVNPVSATEEFYVNDNAGVLTDATEALIYYNSVSLQKACGAEIVVVTVDSVGTTAISDYATAIINDWEVGDATKMNGVVILLAIDDENYYMTIGNGLERAMSAGEVKTILDQYLEPDFAAGRYDDGVATLYNAVFDRVNEIYHANVTREDGATLLARSGAVQQGSTAEQDDFYEEEPARPDTTGRGGISMNGIVILVVILVVIGAVGGAFRRTFRGSYGGYRGRYNRRPPMGPPPMGGPMSGPGSQPRRSSRGFGGFGGFGSFGGSGRSSTRGGFGSFGSSSSGRSSSSRGGFGSSSRSSGGFGGSSGHSSGSRGSFGGRSGGGGGGGRGTGAGRGR